jgi:hypothetical protein
MNPDFADLKQRTEDISNPRHKEISKAMVVLTMALSVGPNADRLTEETGFPKAFVDGIAMQWKKRNCGKQYG